MVVNMKNVMRTDFEIGLYSSDGELIKGTERGVTVLWNKTVIDSSEVMDLIKSGRYEYDDRIIATTPIQADNLKGK